jgi:hypothetical protein
MRSPTSVIGHKAARRLAWLMEVANETRNNGTVQSRFGGEPVGACGGRGLPIACKAIIPGAAITRLRSADARRPPGRRAKRPWRTSTAELGMAVMVVVERAWLPIIPGETRAEGSDTWGCPH